MPPHNGMLLRFLASPFPFGGYHRSFIGPNKYHHFGGWGGHKYYSSSWGPIWAFAHCHQCENIRELQRTTLIWDESLTYFQTPEECKVELTQEVVELGLRAHSTSLPLH
uniref:Uncharacterized protein n=1 Tax=Angiostrongylus cantonensis TaxID=6313 RepID=A0A0K0DGY4_ANGCA